MWSRVKNKWHLIGVLTLAAAFGLIVYETVLIFLDKPYKDNKLYFLALAILSIGIALVAIGLEESDRKFVKILEAVHEDVTKILHDPKQDILSLEMKPPRLLKEIVVDDQSMEATQRRLDEDTKRVGYQRGEIYELKKGSWGIRWGGKYPL